MLVFNPSKHADNCYSLKKALLSKQFKLFDQEKWDLHHILKTINEVRYFYCHRLA